MYYVDRGQIEKRFRYMDEWLLEAVGVLRRSRRCRRNWSGWPGRERCIWRLNWSRISGV